MSTTSSPKCRFCAGPLETTFADLGSTPLANRNLLPGEQSTEARYPLIARVCGSCLLVQVDDSVPPDAIFSDYDYFSSFASSWVEHARRYASAMRERFAINAGSLVVEVASNDGYLLQHFKAAGVPVLGIEPARNVAAAATAKGIETEVAFFGRETAQRLRDAGKAADLMAANNVLAHVPDTRDFVAGFAVLLKPEGVATFEFPHVLRLIEGVQFDTIYHEHFFYLSLVAVDRIMASAGLRVFDVEELSTHGGSLRLFVCHEEAAHQQTAGLAALRSLESRHGLDTLDGYRGFAAKVEAVRASFTSFMAQARAEGKTVAAYGAAAKGNTFLNVCGVGHPAVTAVYDRNPAKQGKLTPGSHIPISDPAQLRIDKPDYVVILPWNIAEEVRSTMGFIADWGGRFVIAVPLTRVL